MISIINIYQFWKYSQNDSIDIDQSLLRIQGSINSQLQKIQQTFKYQQINHSIDCRFINNRVRQISHQLENYNKGSVVALGLIINSQGGCPYQVELLRKKIKNYLNDLPLYTFATEHSLGNAYQLLQLGNKSYAQNTSKIGYTQMYQNKLNFADFFKNYGINVKIEYILLDFVQQYISYIFLIEMDLFIKQYKTLLQYQSSQIVNHNFVVSSSVKSNSQQEIDYLDQYSGLRTKQLTEECWTSRREKIKINKEQLENNIYLGEEAKNLGLIDELGSYEKVLMQQYPKAKIIPINTEGKLREYENWFNLFIKISQSRGFLGLVLLFGVKVMVKWGLIIYVWRQSVKQRKLQKQQELQQ